MDENKSLKIKALVDVIINGMQEKKAENINVSTIPIKGVPIY